MDGKRLVPLFLIGLFIIVAVQIGGFALLWSKDTPPPKVYPPVATDEPSAALPATAPVVVVSPPDEKALREIIQAVLEQELATYARQLAAAPNATQKTVLAEPTDVKENSPENVQAFSAATNIVQAAIAQSMWSEQDNINLSQYAHSLTTSQRRELIKQVAGAIHRQELKTKAIPMF